MTKEILTNLILSQDELTLIRNWRVFGDKIIHFKNNSTLKTFEDILDDKNVAFNLFYRFQYLNKDWIQFETYLKPEWKDLFLTYILRYSQG